MNNVIRYKGFHIVMEQNTYHVKLSNGSILNNVPCNTHVEAVQWIDAYRSRNRNDNNQNIATKEEKSMLTFG